EGQAFQKQYPTAKVTFNFASSSTLRTQLTQGAKADVFASADEVNVQQAQAAGVIDGDRIPFVANQLAIVVSKSSKVVTGLRDLAKPGTKVVLVDPAAPAGTYADEALAKLAADPQYGQTFADAVRKNIVTRAGTVRQATLPVETGEVDAAIVYTTDARVSDKLQAIAFPASLGIRPLYFMGLVKGAPNADGGRAFIAFLRSDAGVQILLKHSFLKP
ncbi:MAG: molybdate ABC transporter substrate-binding protein, partial [Chloroflexi bacterium]|nr:molybdate ABC transporter substrate-binding protein [Chloroflexota bacterium]